MDPWYSMGAADMIEVAHMAVHVAQMGSVADKTRLFEAVTLNPARAMGLADYGLAPGCRADMVVLQAADVTEAIRLKPTRLFVFRGGRVISRTPAVTAALSLKDRPASIDQGLDFRPAC